MDEAVHSVSLPTRPSPSPMLISDDRTADRASDLREEIAEEAAVLESPNRRREEANS